MMRRKYGAMLLLGVMLEEDGSPTQELIARIDEAAKAYFEGVLGDDGVIIVCGGTLPGRHVSEAAVMRDVLMARGVPAARIVMEDKSQLTIENMCFAAQLLGEKKPRVLVVTSDYHLRRSVITAWRAGLRASGRAAALEHDAEWKKKKSTELAYTVDMLMGWQDDGSRPEWTYALFERVFGVPARRPEKNEKNTENKG